MQEILFKSDDILVMSLINYFNKYVFSSSDRHGWRASAKR